MTWTRRVGALLILAGVAVTPALAWRARCPMAALVGHADGRYTDQRRERSDGYWRRTGSDAPAHRARLVRVGAGVPRAAAGLLLAGGPFPGRVDSIDRLPPIADSGKVPADAVQQIEACRAARRPRAQRRAARPAAQHREGLPARPDDDLRAAPRLARHQGRRVRVDHGPVGRRQVVAAPHPRHARHRVDRRVLVQRRADSRARPRRSAPRSTRSTSASCSRATTCSTT